MKYSGLMAGPFLLKKEIATQIRALSPTKPDELKSLLAEARPYVRAKAEDFIDVSIEDRSVIKEFLVRIDAALAPPHTKEGE